MPMHAVVLYGAAPTVTSNQQLVLSLTRFVIRLDPAEQIPWAATPTEVLGADCTSAKIVRRHACHAVPGAGRPPPFGVIRKPRRLDFGEDGTAAPRRSSAAADRASAAPAQRDVLALQRSGSQALPEQQRSDSQSMLELEDLSAVPEDLRRQSESGSLPVSLKALQASLALLPLCHTAHVEFIGHSLSSCCQCRA